MNNDTTHTTRHHRKMNEAARLTRKALQAMMDSGRAKTLTHAKVLVADHTNTTVEFVEAMLDRSTLLDD